MNPCVLPHTCFLFVSQQLPVVQQGHPGATGARVGILFTRSCLWLISSKNVATEWLPWPLLSCTPCIDLLLCIGWLIWWMSDQGEPGYIGPKGDVGSPGKSGPQVSNSPWKVYCMAPNTHSHTDILYVAYILPMTYYLCITVCVCVCVCVYS